MLAATGGLRKHCQSTVIITLHARLSGEKYKSSATSSPESIEEAFYTVGRLIFEDLNAAFHLLRRQRLLLLSCICSCEARGATAMAVLTSILDDFAKAPTGCT